jgi:hypothetical protein
MLTRKIQTNASPSWMGLNERKTSYTTVPLKLDKSSRGKCLLKAVFRIRIRIHRIHVFFGLPDPDPLVSGMDPDPALDPDPDPSIIMQK